MAVDVRDLVVDEGQPDIAPRRCRGEAVGRAQRSVPKRRERDGCERADRERVAAASIRSRNPIAPAMTPTAAPAPSAGQK